MNQLTAPDRCRTESARREYDDGDPGTIVTRPAPQAADATAKTRRAGDWAQGSATTYYDDGEAATILV